MAKVYGDFSDFKLHKFHINLISYDYFLILFFLVKTKIFV
jgi:hypothetical protein